MGLTVFAFEASPPCRGVFITLKALGLEYELKQIDTKAGDTRTPEYLEKNPQHTVPLLEDGDLYLAESRAISTYLVNKYAPDSDLYPKDPKARALVDSRLFFDVGLNTALMHILKPLKYDGDIVRSDAAIPALLDLINIFEAMLAKSEYAAGDHVTLADLAIVANVSTAEAMGLDLSGVPKVRAWLDKIKQLPCYEANVQGVTQLGAMYKEGSTALRAKAQ
ncbi:glutathione S-transferase 1-1-like [Amphibalanus amphitrite]|uniref:glutathione S-transferase 1-1-like n=1 Tax=Amphibalanus amphitrite TaxID=1232801 RepID=UPI001C92AAB5|nr:glutathione S-transferase 1-1-like [Amphibalanus amphitrite]